MAIKRVKYERLSKKPAPTGITFIEMKSKMTAYGFELCASDTYGYDCELVVMRITPYTLSFNIGPTTDTEFYKSLKSILKEVLPTKGTEVYNMVQSNTYVSGMSYLYDGRRVYIEKESDGSCSVIIRNEFLD